MANTVSLDIFSEEALVVAPPQLLYWIYNFVATIANKSNTVHFYKKSDIWICCYQSHADPEDYFELLRPPHDMIEPIRKVLSDLFKHDALCNVIEGRPDGHLVLNLGDSKADCFMWHKHNNGDSSYVMLVYDESAESFVERIKSWPKPDNLLRWFPLGPWQDIKNS